MLRSQDDSKAIASRLPATFRTGRLRLRRWHAEHAPLLLPVLDANVEHLRVWIPEHVWAPLPLPALVHRLEAFAAAFDADREWRYAVFLADEDTLLGEASLFPRTRSARVPLARADRLEIGYWLRSDATGLGYATEAVAGLLGLASSLPRIDRFEIRCDPRNAASAAVARRLGFVLEATGAVPSPESMQAGGCSMIWSHRFERPA